MLTELINYSDKTTLAHDTADPISVGLIQACPNKALTHLGYGIWHSQWMRTWEKYSSLCLPVIDLKAQEWG